MWYNEIGGISINVKAINTLEMHINGKDDEYYVLGYSDLHSWEKTKFKSWGKSKCN